MRFREFEYAVRRDRSHKPPAGVTFSLPAFYFAALADGASGLPLGKSRLIIVACFPGFRRTSSARYGRRDSGLPGLMFVSTITTDYWIGYILSSLIKRKLFFLPLTPREYQTLARSSTARTTTVDFR